MKQNIHHKSRIRNQKRLGMPRILVVDDDSTLAMALLQALQQLGCEVVSTINGRDAIELLKNNHFDLLILDWKMPKFSGYDVIESLCNLFINDPYHIELTELPIIVHTGLTSADLTLPQASTRLERLIFLEKPCRISDIAKAISMALSKHIAA